MKRDRASFFALLAALVILGSVGIVSFFKYKLALETRPLAAAALPSEPAVAATKADPSNAEVKSAAALAQEKASETAAIDQMPRSVLPPIPAGILNPVSSEKKAVRPADGAGSAVVPTGNPAASNAVEALRQETALYQQQLERLRGGTSSNNTATGAPEASAPPIPRPRLSGPAPKLPPGTPNSALQAALNPSGAILAPEPGTGDSPISTGALEASNPAPTPANPAQTEAEIADLAEQIKRQSAIAKVTYYEDGSAAVVLDGGKDRNLKPEMRLAVRRGSEIIGFIKIAEVEATESVAELMSKNKHSPTAKKPQPGDDVIAFNLF